MSTGLVDGVPALDSSAQGPGSARGPLSSRGSLDKMLDAATSDQAGSVLDRFLHEPAAAESLAIWLRPSALPTGPDRRRRLAQQLNRDIAQLDVMLTRQVNAILHHPAFQRLEASWRGLRYLVKQIPEGDNIKIRVLTLTWKELSRDMERALEFDQSQLFRKIYNEEFGIAGGEPYGLLIGDYEIRPRPGPDHPIDDIGALTSFSGVAAAAFAPFVTGAHPSMLQLGSFSELEMPLNLARTFEQTEYLKWRMLRQTEDARFVGLTLPRILLRLPYKDDNSRVDGFRFREHVEAPDRRGYLWGNASYSFAAVVIRAFSQSGWMAGIRGVERGQETGGVVTGLPVHSFATDRTGIAIKCSTDAIITDAQERDIGELGFIPLCHCQDSGLAAFYGCQSVQKPAKYDELIATVNARLSAMLQYMLCVSRFAHYLKVLSRDKVGSFAGPGEVENYLQRWLHQYLMGDDEGTLEMKARYPLREAKAVVRERPDKPGSYMCVIHLRPHFQLDQMVTAVKLVTELSPSQPA